MTKGAAFTKMACFVFGQDPHRLTELHEEFISYAYKKFYNKISRTSLSQWIPNKLDLSRDLILSSVSSGSIKEIELVDGNVIDWQWIIHHFEFESFFVFGFLDSFALPTARPGNLPTQKHGFVVLGIFTKSRPEVTSGVPSIGIVGSILVTEI